MLANIPLYNLQSYIPYIQFIPPYQKEEQKKTVPTEPQYKNKLMSNATETKIKS